MKYTLDSLLKSKGDRVFLCTLSGFSHHSKAEPKILNFKGFKKSLILPRNVPRDFFGDRVGETFLSIIGTLDAMALYEYPILVLSGEKISKSLSEYNEEKTGIFLLNNFTSNFLTQLWMEKDHAVNIHMTYIVERNSENEIFTEKSIDRFWYTDRDGQDAIRTEFSHKEISSAVQRINTIENYENLAPHSAQTLRTSGTNRGEMFQHWLHDARRADDVLIKISKYISALEALLSTSSAELSHQLSERVALLLPPSKLIDQKEIFLEMKGCYSFRSKVIHGGVIKEKDKAKLFVKSEFLDNVCRTFMRELVNKGPIAKITESNPEEIDAIIRDKIFGSG
jgi:hypothetical protein